MGQDLTHGLQGTDAPYAAVKNADSLFSPAHMITPCLFLNFCVIIQLIPAFVKSNPHKSSDSHKEGDTVSVPEIRLGDVVRTRKAHPCGGDQWTVIRTGADIKIRCNTCNHIVMLDRESFLKRRKEVILQGPAPAQV